MGKSCVFINEKGGVGKTSVTFSTARELAKKKKILIVDMDGQRANITYYAGVKKTEQTLTMFDVLLGRTSIKDVIINVNKNLDIIPATNEVTGLSGLDKVKKMKSAIKEIKDDYDYIFFDINGEGNDRTVYILSVCEYVTIVMLPDVASVESNNGIMETIIEVQENANPNLKVAGILFNENINTTMAKIAIEKAEKFANKLGIKVFKTKIRRTVSMGELLTKHVGITEYAPKSAVADDFRMFVKEFEKEVNK